MCSGRRASGVAVNHTSASCHHSLGSSISSAPFAHLRVTSQYVTTLSRLGPVSRAVLAAVLRRPGAPQCEKGDVRVEQFAVHRSPSRKRSRSIGASQPGLNLMRPSHPPSRTLRRLDPGGGPISATGLPWRVMITRSPFSTARISSVRRFLATAVLTSMSQIRAIIYGHNQWTSAQNLPA